jgi:hypothetical protein
MHRFLALALLVCTVAAADAAPLAPTAARADLSVVEPVACVRGGWHGPGVYRGCRYYRPGYPLRPYPYYARPYYPVVPYYAGPRVVVADPLLPAPRQCWIAGAWRPC